MDFAIHWVGRGMRRRGRLRNRMCAVGMITFIVAVAGCRGYQFGDQVLYRPDIHTVHVDMFTSESFRKFLGQRLTEAVVKAIESDTPMRIANRATADSFLHGRLLRERKRVLSETRNDDPRDLQLDYRIEVTWTDRSGVPLMPRQILQLDQSVNFIPESGQSLTTAEQEIINRLAHQVVQQMEMPW